jgi:site-specific recombinase XerD
LRGCNASDTVKVYTNTLKNYLQHLRFDSPELLLKGTKELLENQIIDYIQSQKERGLSSDLIRMRLSAIKLFYEMNRVELSWKYIRRTVGTTKKRKDRTYTLDEIRAILNVADLRTKAIVLLLASTGMRIGALPGLSYKHLIPLDKYGIYKIIVYEGYKEEYHTYCTPECRKALSDYFQYRERCGERLTDETPVIREAFDRNDHFHAAKARRLGKGGIELALTNAVVKAGIRTITRLLEGQKSASVRHPVKLAHGFRKFYDTQMTNAGINLLWVEMLEGHDTKLKESYFRPSESDLLEGNDKMSGYVAAINALTINEENKLRVQLKKTEGERDKYKDIVERRLEDLEKFVHKA